MLAAAHPGVPDFQHDLSASGSKLGEVLAARRDWERAEAAFREAMGIAVKLVTDHPGVPQLEEMSMNHIYRLTVLLGRKGSSVEVRTIARTGLERMSALKKALASTGTRVTERQLQLEKALSDLAGE